MSKPLVTKSLRALLEVEFDALYDTELRSIEIAQVAKEVKKKLKQYGSDTKLTIKIEIISEEKP